MATIIMRYCQRCKTVRLHKPLVLNRKIVGIYCALCGALVESVTLEPKEGGDKRQGGR
ncbi:MAG TPA: hypothetical protein VF458_19310 [Ktedonobacteraceae bacterium]